jgi:hypothetical protein
MEDLQREKKKGLSLWYLKDVMLRRRIIGKRYHTPGFGLAAQLFATMCRAIIQKLGPVEGEALIKEAVQSFGRERGKRIAQKVAAQGKPLTFKNWLIYTDIDGGNFPVKAYIENNDLLAPVKGCTFNNAACEWGLDEYSSIYCKYADYAILEGYNPDIKLILEQRHKTGKDFCLFRYIMKEANKQG